MADSKISGLTPAVSVAGTEEIPANAAGVNYKITPAQLMAYIETAIAIALANGGTGSDLSATGPGFLQQATLGADVTVSPLIAADMPTGIDAANISSGLVSNTEFDYISTLTSDAQTQISGKADSPHKDDHTSAGGDAFVDGDLLDAVARLIVKVAGVAAGANGRRAINLTTGVGSGLSVVATDDSVGEQTNIALDLTGIDATRIGAGAVDNTEFGYLNGVTSAIQTQLNAKASTAHKSTHVAAGADAFVAGDLLDAIARVIVKNNGATVYANGRRGINFQAGAGLSITTTDSSADEHTNVSFALSGGGTSGAMVHIETITLSVADIISFSSITATYRHLVVIGSVKDSSVVDPSNYVVVNFNGDTGSNYSSTTVLSDTRIIIGVCSTSTSSSEIFSSVVFTIPNYANTSIYKTINPTSSFAYAGVSTDDATSGGIWLSTNAINAIDVSAYGGNFVAGSTLSLYGIL